MDKKTIIGLVVIGILILLLPYYQKLLREDKPVESVEQTASQEEVTGEETVTPPGSDVQQETPAEKEESLAAAPKTELAFDTSLAPVDSVDETKVTVVTNLYRAEFSNIGGDITSFKLLEYSKADGEIVDLVSPYAEHTLEFQLETESSRFSTKNVPFTYEGDTMIVLENPDEAGEIVFSTVMPNGLQVLRKYQFKADSYIIDHNVTAAFTDSTYIKNSTLWWNGGLYPTEQDVNQELRYFKFCDYLGGEFNREGFKKGKEISIQKDGLTDWAATANKYFSVILSGGALKYDGVKATGEWHTETIGDKEYDIPEIEVGLVSKREGVQVSQDYIIYIGPQDFFRLKDIGYEFHKVVDFGWQILAPLASGLLWVFVKIHKVIPNYGLVIIIFSLLIKVILYPLTRKQLKSMSDMKKLQPQMNQLREEYKNDPQKLNAQMMKLYKEHGVNPLGGCLPLVLQMPIFFALFRVFYNTIELRAQPFLFWITDLSQKDPYYILPIIMCVTMFIQQKISVQDPKQKMMAYIMPVFFFLIFRNMPSGLVLYWTTFNVLSVIHQYLMDLGGKEEVLSLKQNE